MHVLLLQPRKVLCPGFAILEWLVPVLQEYCEGGDLRNALDKPSLAVPLSWDRRGHTLGMDIAAGLNFLHGKKACLHA